MVAVKKNQRLPNKGIKGNALVLALMIVAVTSVIAYALIETSTFAVRRTTQLNDMDMCRQAVHAAELYAGGLLNQPQEPGQMITQLQQPWARPFEMQLGKDIALQAQVSDLQGQFNINLLQNNMPPSAYTPEAIFTRLLVLLDIADSQTLSQALTHWVQEATTESDQVYLERTPAYRAGHASLASISELQLIQGFSQQTMALLTPYVSALPQGMNINVNTASAEVLAALLNTSSSTARTLVDERMAYAFKNNQEFLQRAMAKAIAIPDQGAVQEMISVNSQYFLLKTTATCKKTTLISYSFIKRLSEGQTKVYQRTQQL